MGTAIRPIGHEDRLSIVDHLDELRTRILICVAAFSVCFGIALWQNDRILGFMDTPLEKTAFKDGTSKDPFEQTSLWQQAAKEQSLKTALALRSLAREESVSAETKTQLEQAAQASVVAAEAAPGIRGKRPITIGVGEPFTVTLRVAAYAALLFCLPILLFQAYAFVLPAFSQRERQVALPLMLMVPFLFVAGVVFAYFLVLPKAIDFLQNFNDDNFDILLQARDYYRFAILLLVAMGIMFQIPVGILALTRMRIVSVPQLRAWRRYAVLVIAVVAMLAPGGDPVTMTLIMIPLLILYEGSILLAAALDRRASRLEDAEAPEAAEPIPDQEPNR
jgi:sec-independent protein translocase protein TatC